MIRAVVPASILASTLAACQPQPPLVYVPATEPQVQVTVGASAAEAAVGEPLVLWAERLNYGEWRAVKRRTLEKGQCWLRRPPPEREAAVADNLTWKVDPPGAHRFDLAFRADHRRKVVFLGPGTYTLKASSTIWCRPGELAWAPPIRIRVREADSRSPQAGGGGACPARAAGSAQCRLQPEVLGEGHEIPVRVKERQAVLDAEGRNDHVDGLAYCDALPAQSPEVLRAPDRHVLAKQIEDGERRQQLRSRLQAGPRGPDAGPRRLGGGHGP
jgi:hypothetical protein